MAKKINVNKEKVVLIEEGHKYIHPDLYQSWDEYISSFTQDYQVLIAKYAVSVMSRLEQDHSFGNIIYIAKEAYNKFEGIYFLNVRGILFNFSKFGPEFGLALECAKKMLTKKMDYREKDDIVLDLENVMLIVRRMMENRAREESLGLAEGESHSL